MVLQQKEVGTQVDFIKGWDISLQYYTFRDDIFGVRAYQPTPVTVTASVHDAFLNGSLSDIQTQSANQGMNILYMLVTWNETQQTNGDFLITDLVVGVVAQVARDFNTGPAYLIDAMKAVSWFSQFYANMGMPWVAWILLQQSANRVTNYTWFAVSVSDTKYVSKPIEESLPELPTAQAAIDATNANTQAALGAFTVELLDKGYTPTLLNYKVSACFEKSPNMRHPGGYFWGYSYKLHIRVALNFTTVPEIAEVADQQRLLDPITWAIIIKIIAVVIGLLVAGYALNTLAYNLTHKSSGSVTEYYDANGNLIKRVINWEEGPPDWWGFVIPVVALMGVGAGVYLLLPYFRKGEGRKK